MSIKKTNLGIVCVLVLVFIGSSIALPSNNPITHADTPILQTSSSSSPVVNILSPSDGEIITDTLNYPIKADVRDSGLKQITDVDVKIEDSGSNLILDWTSMTKDSSNLNYYGDLYDLSGFGQITSLEYYNGYIWVLSPSTRRVYQLNPDGTLVGSYYLGSGYYLSLTYGNGRFFVLDTTYGVRVYNTAFNLLYSRRFPDFYIVQDIEYIYDGTYETLHCYEVGGSVRVYSYVFSPMYYVGSYYPTEDSSPKGITYDDDNQNWYMIGIGSNKIYKYDITWNYLDSYDISDEMTNGYDVLVKNDHFLALNMQSHIYPYDFLYEYNIGTTLDPETYTIFVKAKNSDLTETQEQVSFSVPSPPEITIDQLDDYLVGTTGNELIFTIDLVHHGLEEMYVFVDSVQIFWGSPIEDGVPQTVNIDGYSTGIHDVEIRAYVMGYPTGYLFDSFEVNAPLPIITINQLDDYYEGETGNQLIFTVDCPFESQWYINLDGFPHGSGTYTDDVPVAVNIDNWGVGIHSIKITAFNSYGDSSIITDSFEVLIPPPPIIEATVDFDPDTLNLKSKGKWVTCYIELPEGYDVNDINLETILLNGEISVELSPSAIGDYDNDEIPDLMIKFSRESVQSILYIGDEIEITITGELNDDTEFEGTDEIKVIEPPKH